MKPVSKLQPVTLVREQFTPSHSVKEALNKFIDDDEIDFRLYSTAQRVIDQVAFHKSRYDHEINAIQNNLQAMGKRALLLTGRTRLIDRPDGSVRLLIEPGEQEQIDNMAALLNLLPGGEVQQPPHSGLYVNIAKASLTESIQQRRDATDNFLARGRHPTARNGFTVTNPRVVAYDFVLTRPDVLGDDTAS